MTPPSVSATDCLSRHATLFSTTASSSGCTVTSPSPPVPHSLPDYLSYLNLDLLVHTASFLSISDLFQCSSICRALHDAFDSDKGWKQRLVQAQRTQATIETYSQQLSSSSSSSSSSSDAADHHHDRVRDGAQQRAELTASSSATSSSSLAAGPSLLEAYHVIDAYCRKALSVQQPDVDSLILSIRQAAATASPSSSHPTVVFHVKRIRYPAHRAYEAVVDYRDFVLGWEQENSGWTVQRVGSRDSGLLVLNSDDNAHELTGPAPPPPAAAASCKQRYVALLSCSEHRHQRCFTLLLPSPSLASPPPPPAWFSQHLRDAVAHRTAGPPLPVSAFPAFHPLPLCAACRALVVAEVDPFFTAHVRGWAHRLQLACIQRVNSSEYDCRLLHYENEQEHRRCVVRFHSPSRQYRCERLYQAVSGVYAIAPDSNVPWQEPAGSTGQTLRGWAGHEHPLRHFMRCPYVNNHYTCNECGAGEQGEVWHCSRCQFDLCPACRQQVETARLPAATATLALPADAQHDSQLTVE